MSVVGPVYCPVGSFEVYGYAAAGVVVVAAGVVVVAGAVGLATV